MLHHAAFIWVFTFANDMYTFMGFRYTWVLCPQRNKMITGMTGLTLAQNLLLPTLKNSQMEKFEAR